MEKISIWSELPIRLTSKGNHTTIGFAKLHNKVRNIFFSISCSAFDTYTWNGMTLLFHAAHLQLLSY